MSTVASVNYVTKRIYLSATTVGVALDTMQVYRDVRALRATTESHRAFRPMIVGGGNIQKTATTYTQPYVQLLYGCRIIPFDMTHSLVVVRDTFTDDGASGVGCFDRSAVAAEVDIDIQVAAVEVREVTVGGSTGPTAAEIASAVLATLQANVLQANMVQVKGQALAGSGSEAEPWGPGG